MTKRLNVLLMTVAAAFTLGTADARTLRIANQGDALSMDPHSLNESLQLSSPATSTKPLVGRDKTSWLAPAWPRPGSRPRPTCGDLKLRKGVNFP
jgi:peptide/nickel transport system substrate-binding protein